MAKRIENSLHLDIFYNMQEGTFTYPSVCVIEEDMDEFPVLFDSLPTGNLPVLVPFQGKLVEVGQVSKNLETIYTLLKFYPLDVLISLERRVRVTTMEELIELDDFDWS